MFFKRPVNVNFITILPIVILLGVLAGLSGMAAVSVAEEVGVVSGKIGSMRGNVDDVTGWGILILGLAGAISSALVVLCWVAAITLLVIALLLFIPLLAARLVYRNRGGRLLAYRIIMGVEYVFLSLFILLLISLMADVVISAVILLPCILLVGAALVVNIVNTYSDRIKRY